MRVVKERTAIIQVSDLRTELDAVLRQLKDCPVQLEKHHKPVAVLLDPGRFAEMEQTLERAEDLLLAFEARARESSSKRGTYLTLEEMERRVL